MSYRTIRRISVAIPLMASLALGSPVGAASDVTPPELVGIIVSPNDISVSGLDHDAVTVSVHLRDDVGVVATGQFDGEPVRAIVGLTNTTPGASMRDATAYLTLPEGGNPADGTWVATFLAGSNADGTWRVTRVSAGDAAGNQLNVDPATLGIDAELTVHGSHRPAITLGFAPQPASGDKTMTMKGRAYFTDDGSPIANRRVTIGFGADWNADPCINQVVLGSVTTTTDASGYYGYVLKPPLDQGIGCVFLTDPTVVPFDAYAPIAILAVRSRTPIVRYAVSAAMSARYVSVGQATRVSGRVQPGPATVHLQRRLASGAWVNVVTTSVGLNGAYSVRVVPPRGRGTYAYRVYVPGCCDGHLLGKLSKTLYLTVL